MIKWQAPEYVYYEKDVSWFWLMIIFAILIVAFALWQHNFLFAIFTIVAAFMLMAWGYRRPDLIDFELNDSGLKIGEKFYPKENFNHFSLQKETDGWHRLFLKNKKQFSLFLTIPTPPAEFDNIRNYCLNFWTEIEREESLIDVLSNFFRF